MTVVSSRPNQVVILSKLIVPRTINAAKDLRLFPLALTRVLCWV